jgi:hypothetical protein
MVELKKLSREAVPAALDKAHRYRLLNEAWEAESICRDVLEVDEENPRALTTLLLALTDQFDEPGGATVEQAREVLSRLGDEYSREYYGGIICERRAKAQLRADLPASAHLVYDWFRQALERFERAAALRPAGNDDALLRWNACARLLQRHPELVPESDEPFRTWLE